MADPTPRTTPTRDEAVLNAADQMRRAIESADPAPVAQIVEWRLLLLDMKEALMWATYSNSALRGRVEAAEAALSAPAPASGGVDAVDEWKRIAKEAEARANFLAEIIRDCPEARNVWGQRIADEAADTLASLSPAATPVSCTYCGDTKTITDRVDGEITCPECGYEKRAATPVSEAGGRTGAEMIARHRFRLDADNNTAEIDSNGLAEEIDAALAKPAPSPALQPDAVSEPLAPQPPGCSGGDVHSDLVKRLNALVAKPGRDWRTGDEFIHGVHSQDIVDIIREASAALSPATVGRGALRSRG